MKSKEDLFNLYIRATFGLSLFIAHGLVKFHMIDTPGVASFPDVIGIGSTLSFYGNFFAEFVCSGLLIIGLFTRLSAAVLTFNMCIAAFKFHATNAYAPIFLMNLTPDHPLLFVPFKEYPLLYAFAFIPFIFFGGGALSLDSLIFRKKNTL
jgi:putative oxidoreductase